MANMLNLKSTDVAEIAKFISQMPKKFATSRVVLITRGEDSLVVAKGRLHKFLCFDLSMS